MARPVVDGHSIVINGAWNIRIFSPEWVAANLAPETDVGLAVAVGNPTAPIRLQFRGIYLRVGAERLVFSPVHLSDQALTTMQDVARTVVTMLPHTPMSAVGINFQYLVEDPPVQLLDVFRFSDNGPLAEFGAEIESAMIRRSTRFREAALNLVLALRADAAATIEFNNHSEITGGAEALTAINRPILELRDTAIDGLRSLYGLEVH